MTSPARARSDGAHGCRSDSLVSQIGVGGLVGVAGGAGNASAGVCGSGGGILRDSPAGLCWRLMRWHGDPLTRDTFELFNAGLVQHVLVAGGPTEHHLHSILDHAELLRVIG